MTDENTITVLERGRFSTEEAAALVRGRLSTQRRWWYRGLLLVVTAGLAALLSLWLTEPGPLPLRLHIAFGGLAAIDLSWATVLTLLVTRRYCPTVLDRIITAWVAVGATLLFLLGSVTICLLRHEPQYAWGFGFVALTFLGVAVLRLHAAYELRASLRRNLAALS